MSSSGVSTHLLCHRICRHAYSHVLLLMSSSGVSPTPFVSSSLVAMPSAMLSCWCRNQVYPHTFCIIVLIDMLFLSSSLLLAFSYASLLMSSSGVSPHLCLGRHAFLYFCRRLCRHAFSHVLLLMSSSGVSKHFFVSSSLSPCLQLYSLCWCPHQVYCHTFCIIACVDMPFLSSSLSPRLQPCCLVDVVIR